MTDVTGFGLLGHLLEVCRASRVGAHVEMSDVPLLDHALALAGAGLITGASARNWASYGDEVRLGPHVEGVHRDLLCDPQTSGGLLVACARETVPEVIEIFARHGFEHASVIGGMIEGESCVIVDR